MISGDSHQSMTRREEYESVRGKAQSIHSDPPYGIKFKSNRRAQKCQSFM